MSRPGLSAKVDTLQQAVKPITPSASNKRPLPLDEEPAGVPAGLKPEQAPDRTLPSMGPTPPTMGPPPTKKQKVLVQRFEPPLAKE